MAKLMRCTTSHFQGNNFIAQGTILPEGNEQVIPQFFEVVEYQDPEPKVAPKGNK